MKECDGSIVKTRVDEPAVLVIDDEESMREGYRQTLEAEGYRALVAGDGKGGLNLVETMKPRVVFVDLRLPGMSGMDVLGRIHELDDSIISIVITGYGTVKSAVEAMKVGAFDYLEKPLTPEQIVELVEETIPIAMARARTGTGLPERDEDEAFVIRLILRKASRDKVFGRRLLYEGRQELSGWALSPEARSAIVSGNIAWITKRCGGLSAGERKWLDKKPW